MAKSSKSGDMGYGLVLLVVVIAVIAGIAIYFAQKVGDSTTNVEAADANIWSAVGATVSGIFGLAEAKISSSKTAASDTKASQNYDMELG